MNLKSFQDWLDRNLPGDGMRPAPANELQLIYAGARRDQRVDAKSLLFCLASVVLTISIIFATRTPNVTPTVTKDSKNDLLHADEELDRDLDASLEHFNTILNSSRQM